MQYLLYLVIICCASPAFSADTEAASEPEQVKMELQMTDGYVHNWTKFPEVVGSSIFTSRVQSFKPKAGRAMAVWFLASYSEKSQRILPEVLRMQKKYEALFTDFVFVFVNDQPVEAQGMSKEFGLTSNAIIGEDKVKKEFKYQTPPSVYFADRHGWLNWMAFELDVAKLDEIDRYLAKLNVM